MAHRIVASASCAVRCPRQQTVSSAGPKASRRFGVLLSTAWVMAVIVTPTIAVPADLHRDGGWQSETMKCLHGGALANRTSFQNDAFAGVSHCLLNRFANAVLGHGFMVGQELLGKQARFFGRTAWDYEEGLQGELDTIVPLTASPAIEQTLRAPHRLPRALFLQTGVTTWRDDGARRTDARTGVIYRFGLSDDLEDGVLGAMTFLQEDLRTRHRRWVAGLDYLGRRLSGSFQYYLPATSWRFNRDGFEQRPLAGMKLDFGVNLLSNVRAGTSISRWETGDGSHWDTRTGLRLSWHPTPWLGVFSRYSRKAEETDELVSWIAATIPLGGPKRRYGRLSGVVQVADGGEKAGPDALWRPAAPLEPIRYADRSPSSENCAEDGEDASLRFTHGEADSGDTIGLEAELPAPACDRLMVTARLIPGEGNHPAVPGVDYNDSPIDITIVEGQRRGVAHVTLLYNAALAEERSLSAEIISF